MDGTRFAERSKLHAKLLRVRTCPCMLRNLWTPRWIASASWTNTQRCLRLRYGWLCKACSTQMILWALPWIVRVLRARAAFVMPGTQSAERTELYAILLRVRTCPCMRRNLWTPRRTARASCTNTQMCLRCKRLCKACSAQTIVWALPWIVDILRAQAALVMAGTRFAESTELHARLLRSRTRPCVRKHPWTPQWTARASCTSAGRFLSPRHVYKHTKRRLIQGTPD